MTTYSAGVERGPNYAPQAPNLRSYLVRSTRRFLLFWMFLVLLGLGAGASCLWTQLYGFAFSGFVGAIAAAVMVWTAFVQLREIHAESDRSLLVLSGPLVRNATMPVSEKPKESN